MDFNQAVGAASLRVTGPTTLRSLRVTDGGEIFNASREGAAIFGVPVVAAGLSSSDLTVSGTSRLETLTCGNLSAGLATIGGVSARTGSFQSLTAGKVIAQGDGGGGTVCTVPSSTDGEASIGFYRRADRVETAAGDIWVLGHNSHGAGAGNFGLGTAVTGLVLTIRPDGSTVLGPVSASSVSSPTISATGATLGSLTVNTATIQNLNATDATVALLEAGPSTLVSLFVSAQAEAGSLRVAGLPGAIDAFNAGPTGVTMSNASAFRLNLSNNLVATGGTTILKSLRVVDGRPICSIGDEAGAVFGVNVSAPSFNSSSDLTVSGLSRLETLTAGSVTTRSLTPSDIYGTVNLRGTLTVSGAIQAGTTSGSSYPSPVRYPIGSWSDSQQFYRLGRWTAAQTGQVIKLTVVSCNNGYNFRSGGNTVVNPLVAETTILFHTSNNVDFVDVVGNEGFLPNKCYGWGWAYSLHACRQVAGVFVCPNRLDRTLFEFWISLYGYSGMPLVEASTTAVWEPSVSMEASLPSTGHVPLQIATASTTLTPGNTYVNTPEFLPPVIM